MVYPFLILLEAVMVENNTLGDKGKLAMHDILLFQQLGLVYSRAWNG